MATESVGNGASVVDLFFVTASASVVALQSTPRPLSSEVSRKDITALFKPERLLYNKIQEGETLAQETLVIQHDSEEG